MGIEEMGHTVAAARLHLKLRRVGDGEKAEHLTLGSLSCPWQYLTGIYGINSRNDHQQNLRQYFSMSMQLKVVNKCWTFSSPEVFCDTAEVPKGVFACGCGSASDPAGKLPTLPKPSSQLGRGTYPLHSPTFLDTFGKYSRKTWVSPYQNVKPF